MLVKVSVVLVLCQLFRCSQAAAIPLQATNCSKIYESCQRREDCCSNNQICQNEMCSTVTDPGGPLPNLAGKSVSIPENPGCGLKNGSCKDMMCCFSFFCNTDFRCEEESLVPVGGYSYTGVGDQSAGVPGSYPLGIGGNPDPYGYPYGGGIGGPPPPPFQ